MRIILNFAKSLSRIRIFFFSDAPSFSNPLLSTQAVENEEDESDAHRTETDLATGEREETTDAVGETGDVLKAPPYKSLQTYKIGY